MKQLQSGVIPPGKFQYGIHKPSYTTANLREHASIVALGQTEDQATVNNSRNFPEGDVIVASADWIYEIPNAFPFKGRTYIDKEWADASAKKPERIRLPQPAEVSFSDLLGKECDETIFSKLPAPLHLALATCSTDSKDLIQLAHISCDLIMEGSCPQGLRYKKREDGELRPIIHNHPLFEAVANNPHLPDSYKIVMVIRPGAQGGSEIIGEWLDGDTSHVFEYLRRNSYIPGGHYAANMADDAIRYSIDDLSLRDIQGLRHLYYQRCFVRLATELEIPLKIPGTTLTPADLEQLRVSVLTAIERSDLSPATLWGWNFGFDFAPSLYRLHASHQQIHQQYAMVPEKAERYTEGCNKSDGDISAYSLGDQLTDFIKEYREINSRDFFVDFLSAIRGNKRMDSRHDLSHSLVVWEDERIIVYVPKAQTSQWELQLMVLPDRANNFPGNIVECDTATRLSIDKGLLAAQMALAGIGAKMVTSIEYSKRLNSDIGQTQPLIYALLPRLPESPGAFSEAQLRFINGHYPEDFAAVCREQVTCVSHKLD